MMSFIKLISTSSSFSKKAFLAPLSHVTNGACFATAQRGTSTEKSDAASSPSIDMKEIEHFRSLSAEWWNPNGKLGALLSLNELRVPLVRDCVPLKKQAKPLKGLKILDVGCGGGFFCEPLARLGAQVTGLDPVLENIQIATAHAALDPSISQNLTYVCNPIEEHLKSGESYDIVVCSEVVEHVNNVPEFVSHCAALVKVGGYLLFTTINRTYLSFIGVIIAAEYIFGVVPKGTHQWNKLVQPSELQDALEKASCQTTLINGFMYNPLTKKWYFTDNTSFNYAMCAVKTGEPNTDSKIQIPITKAKQD